MFLSQPFLSLLLLPAALRGTLAELARRSTACNNSPQLCDQAYNDVTYLGAHDSPFVRDDSTGFSASGNQFYNSTIQLSAGVRLLTAQVQLNGGALHVCHSECTLLDAGPLSSWLAEIKSWLDSNPDNVVTILLVNGASASAEQLAAQYDAAGITSALAYTPTGSNAQSQDWPTLQSLINSGTRLVNFVDYIGDNSAEPWLMSEFDFIFENPYDVTSLSGFQCGVNRPPSDNGSTSRVVADGMMPLMNHFMYENAGFGIQIPAVGNITTTNAPGGGIGTLGYSANQCQQEYGRAPAYILVDFFNVGPAIATVDRLNGVSNPVGRTGVSRDVLTASSAGSSNFPRMQTLCVALLTVSFVLAAL